MSLHVQVGEPARGVFVTNTIELIMNTNFRSFSCIYDYAFQARRGDLARGAS